MHYQISPDKAFHMTDLMTERLSVCLLLLVPLVADRHSSKMQATVGARAELGFHRSEMLVLKEYPPVLRLLCRWCLNISGVLHFFLTTSREDVLKVNNVEKSGKDSISGPDKEVNVCLAELVG